MTGPLNGETIKYRKKIDFRKGMKP
jgi:hypothetical protein